MKQAELSRILPATQAELARGGKGAQWRAGGPEDSRARDSRQPGSGC